jgi:thioredoxin 1
MSKAAAVTTAEFDSVVLQSEVPVLVDFWAAWCGPCRRVAPEIDAVAEQFGEKAKVVKVDVDAEGELAARYGIQAIPALFVFKGGQVVEQIRDQTRQGIGARVAAHV